MNFAKSLAESISRPASICALGLSPLSRASGSAAAKSSAAWLGSSTSSISNFGILRFLTNPIT
jgi:hypothetical protein